MILRVSFISILIFVLSSTHLIAGKDEIVQKAHEVCNGNQGCFMVVSKIFHKASHKASIHTINIEKILDSLAQKQITNFRVWGVYTYVAYSNIDVFLDFIETYDSKDNILDYVHEQSISKESFSLHWNSND